MISNNEFLKTLQDEGVGFFTGVPDSLLKEICACITASVAPQQHVIAANEGAAVGLATGYHIATRRMAMVYLQNSGLGNTVNPLLSIADREVYSIPMLLMIGWRGEPGVKDEPQHVKQGRVQNGLLDAMELPYEVIGPDTRDYASVVRRLLAQAQQENRPVALVVQKGTFVKWEGKETGNSGTATQTEERPGTSAAPQMKREEALEAIIRSLDDDTVVVSTTGMPSREIFEIRAQGNMGHHRDFLTVGSMGHCSQIALGAALSRPERTICCVDGDGALIMHMGSLAIIGANAPKGFKHIVVNNGAHDSVGGQPTVAFDIDIPAIAMACGYRKARRVSDPDGLREALDWLARTDGPVLLEVQVARGARKDLGRPTRTPIQNKTDLMDHLAQKQSARPIPD